MGRKHLLKSQLCKEVLMYFPAIRYINAIFRSAANCFEISNGPSHISCIASLAPFSLCCVLALTDPSCYGEEAVCLEEKMPLLSQPGLSCLQVSACSLEGRKTGRIVLLRHPSKGQNHSLISLAHGNIGND